MERRAGRHAAKKTHLKTGMRKNLAPCLSSLIGLEHARPGEPPQACVAAHLSEMATTLAPSALAGGARPRSGSQPAARHAGARLALQPRPSPLAMRRPRLPPATAALPALPFLSPSPEALAQQDLITLVTDPALARGAKGGKSARVQVEAAIDSCIAAAGKGPTPPTATDARINGGMSR